MPPDPEEEPEMAHALKTGARTDDEPDAPELGGNPALVAYGEELACKIIESGEASLNTSHQGRTALEIAISCLSIRVVTALVKGGCETNALPGRSSPLRGVLQALVSRRLALGDHVRHLEQQLQRLLARPPASHETVQGLFTPSQTQAQARQQASLEGHIEVYKATHESSIQKLEAIALKLLERKVIAGGQRPSHIELALQYGSGFLLEQLVDRDIDLNLGAPLVTLLRELVPLDPSQA